MTKLGDLMADSGVLTGPHRRKELGRLKKIRSSILQRLQEKSSREAKKAMKAELEAVNLEIRKLQ